MQEVVAMSCQADTGEGKREGHCCAPSAQRQSLPADGLPILVATVEQPRKELFDQMVSLPGGIFLMGTD